MPWEGRKVGVMSVVRGSMEGSQVAEEVVLPGAAEVLRRALMPDEAIDEALAQAADGGVALTGEGGFLPELVKAVLERGLAVELDDHLGYAKGDPAGRGSPNSRNGFTPKTLQTEVGQVPLDVPRDRNGSFEPRLVPKGSRRSGGLTDIIVSLYSGGMTVRDIQHHLARMVGSDLSHETTWNITDAVAEEVLAWQTQPLDAGLPGGVPGRPGGEGRGEQRGPQQGRAYRRGR